MKPRQAYRQILLLIFILSHLSLFQPIKSYANGAIWASGFTGGMPGPIKQNYLVLKKEHVIMIPKVTVDATFWVFNPTENDINEEIGFPLFGDFPIYEKYIFDLKNIIKLFVSDKEEVFEININKKSEYPIVINWKMKFPKNSTTSFRVIYPLISSHSSADVPLQSYSEINNYGYITHTGGYWAKPIEDATFEFCGDVAEFLIKNPGGGSVEYSDEGWEVTSKFVHVNPSDYFLDNQTNCIIWERHNWIPKKGVDDISIKSTNSSESYRFLPFDENGNYQTLDDFLFKGLCGNDEHEGEQFARLANLDSTNFSYEVLGKLVKSSYVYAGGDPDGSNGDLVNPFYDLPDYLYYKYQLLLLRYLRNSIFAKYGYQFKDEKLKNCFAETEIISGQPSDIEKQNLNKIQNLENVINDRYKELWPDVIRKSQ